jgi:spermidine synthase
MTTRPRLPRPLLAGIFFISMAMLLLEVILTRLFSVTMFYHFAFMVVSISLFGLAVSGTLIYLKPEWFPARKVGQQMTLAATLFALAVPICYIMQHSLPSAPDSPNFGFLYLLLTYIIIAVPFFLGGTAISLGLTHYSSGVALLYFADLVGASIGCALVFPAMSLLTGPDIIAVVAVLGAFSAVSVSFMSSSPAARARSFAVLAAVTVLLVLNTTEIFRPLRAGQRILTNPVTKEVLKPIALDWNPMSRVLAYQGSTRPSFHPGMSPDSVFFPHNQILMQIDQSAMTWAVGFDGDFKKVDWIYTDVSTLPLFLRPGGKLLDIGSGGGQNALAAIGLGSKDVTCVEINPTIVDWTKHRFDEVTGHIYNRPEVRVFTGDGRTFVAGSKETYDVIAFVSSTTFTATTSGAFMIAENNLFTREAFQSYFDHLTPNGLIGVSQVMTRDYPGLLLRVASLGRQVLEDNGLTDITDHVLVIMKKAEGYGVVLISKSPLTAAELDRADSLATEMSWVVLHSPRVNNHREFHEILSTPDFASFLKLVPLNLYPPTDDRPFFFNLVPFSRLRTTKSGNYDLKYGQTPAIILLNLFYIVLALTFLFLIVPLILNRRARIAHRPGAMPTLGYFMAIGLAFIMVEVPLMQRFVLFLGHPAYSIAVVLFSILLFSGVGSMLTKNLHFDTAGRWLKWSLPALLLNLVLYSFALEAIFTPAQQQPEFVKIAISIILLIPLGLLMGMPFPAMLRRTSEFAPQMVPWCWGLNGAASVLGSVSAVIIALTAGFSASLLIGALAYASALLFVWILPSSRGSEVAPATAHEDRKMARVGTPGV